MSKRLDNIEKKNNDNTTVVDKVERIIIKVNAENFMKQVTEIPILVNAVVAANEGGGTGGGGAG
jgi:hypothetical protein